MGMDTSEKLCYSKFKGENTMQETFKNTFKSINAIKREIVLNHPEVFNNPALMKAIFEVELHVRSLQHEAHKSGIMEGK